MPAHARSVRRGLLAQVKSPFSLPPVGMAVCGALLADTLVLGVVAVHALTVFAAMYAAHLRDSEVDYYVRGEDASTSLSRRVFRIVFAVTMAAFVVGIGRRARGRRPARCALDAPARRPRRDRWTPLF